MDRLDLLNLKKRYLLWLYKVTKEELDKIERKFTQLDIDRFILERLKKAKTKNDFSKFITDFQSYIANKEADGLKLKYEGKSLKPEYEFLLLKLAAVEKAISKALGAAGLKKIKRLYENEMSERILKSREH
ncbi:MAG: hypothetical protein Q8N85_00765 [Candidatus Omnitrophota bacterium]|nr:hypothetical protein [Candidatus Omnitrophota bacterium]